MQNPQDLTDVRCDMKGCDKPLGPKDWHVRFTLHRLWGGPCRHLFVCRTCVVEKLGLNDEALDALR